MYCNDVGGAEMVCTTCDYGHYITPEECRPCVDYCLSCARVSVCVCVCLCVVVSASVGMDRCVVFNV